MAAITTTSEPTIDVGRLLDEGRWTGYQQRLVALTALAIIFDGADNQLLGTAIPAIMRDWQLARAAFALHVLLERVVVHPDAAQIEGRGHGRRRGTPAAGGEFGRSQAGQQDPDHGKWPSHGSKASSHQLW